MATMIYNDLQWSTMVFVKGLWCCLTRNSRPPACHGQLACRACRAGSKVGQLGAIVVCRCSGTGPRESLPQNWPIWTSRLKNTKETDGYWWCVSVCLSSAVICCQGHQISCCASYWRIEWTRRIQTFRGGALTGALTGRQALVVSGRMSLVQNPMHRSPAPTQFGNVWKAATFLILAALSKIEQNKVSWDSWFVLIRWNEVQNVSKHKDWKVTFKNYFFVSASFLFRFKCYFFVSVSIFVSFRFFFRAAEGTGVQHRAGAHDAHHGWSRRTHRQSEDVLRRQCLNEKKK